MYTVPRIRDGGTQARNVGAKSAKDVQTKVPGRGGGRVSDDAQMGALLSRCGGRINKHYIT